MNLRPAFFNTISPIYGHIGIEESVPGIECLLNDSNLYFSAKNTFLSNECFQRKKDEIVRFAMNKAIASIWRGKFEATTACSRCDYSGLMHSITLRIVS